MNATIHAQISQKRWGGDEKDFEFYYKLHDFCDVSKEVDATNRHRVYFHTMPFVKRVVIPLFGNTYVNSVNRKINIKDMVEQDHILADYGGYFIPSMQDFIDCVEDNKEDQELIDDFAADNRAFFELNPEIKDLIYTPLHITGKIKSLLLTHNSWFINYIIPMLHKTDMQLKDFGIAPGRPFNRMDYKNWMNNGMGTPPSCAKVIKFRKVREVKYD